MELHEIKVTDIHGALCAGAVHQSIPVASVVKDSSLSDQILKIGRQGLGKNGSFGKVLARQK